MSAFALVQDLVLGALLVFCLVSAARKLMPQTSKRLFGRLAAALDRPSRGRALRWMARRLQPADAKRGSCGDGDGCGSCGGCGSAPYQGNADPHVQPLHFKPHSHSR
ncbi:DUF6587 family protein [Oleiagrimonas sp. C23AA]|uniref:DUF6587 family protein n=1 Tax=Oleiagrimonas sp. C23AA TaxID=2719047 RepID=UPI001423EED9|nr:DUF6587 family protein [Oleiagrimonas sp. C23AA]NII10261.1 hypothetical protein [Oleiagrimonas sp. C23AA]